MICYLVLFSLLVSQGYTKSIGDAQRYRVVIVGAGVSGFTAAATLLEHNVTDLVVLEAADRIGGRINTVQFGGVPIDKGAEFCHGEEDNRVYELVSPYNFLASYQDLLDGEQCMYVNSSGARLDTQKITNIIEIAMEHEMFGEELSHFNGSIGDFFNPRLDVLLRSENVDPQLSDALKHRIPQLECVSSATDSLYELGAWGSSNYKECGGDQILKWRNGTGGYKTLFDIISKKFPTPSEGLPVLNKTVLGKQVTRIERKAGEVEVTCADGSTYLADHVIVSVSLGVLKKHAADMFHPALPADKTAAIETLGFGCVGKVFLLFPNRWWPEDINAFFPLFSQSERENIKTTSAYGEWLVNVTDFAPVMNHDRMLCAWIAGQACRTMEAMTEEQVTDALLELLNILVGKSYNITRPEAILRTNWGSYPYTLGSYSHRTVASDRKNLTNNDLAESVLDDTNKPVLLFAGEATHPHYYSTVHGALDTGRREANKLIQYFDLTSKA